MSPIMSTFIPLTYPFMDPKTAAKFHIDEDPLKDGVVDADTLIEEWGGKSTVSLQETHIGPC